MEAHDESLIYTFNLSGEEPQLIEISNSNDHELLPESLLAFSSKLWCRASFPTAFFDQDNEAYQKNVNGFVALLQLCLLNKRGLKPSEKTMSNNHETKRRTTETMIPHAQNR